ncbi:hypothetical protein CGZ96_19850 [Enemella evansiae]|uniref:TFIIB-type zinc ribbon-containing protein n=1 Tax=Enemella evansiae TaxID=2016499 RepID=UPI000B97709E|nr:zf-TFIIB domain-containing protein [Enemella evansiae]OYN94114.1 hypothetical protein CGZ96_19850 [Enemella evansiae]
MELICPKCGAPMRQYERNGVVVDQCTGCRGILLDAGELERLTQAETQYYQQGGYGRGPAMPRGRGGWGSADSPGSPGSPNRYGYGNRGGYGKHGGKQNRGQSFLRGLFD